MLHPTTSFHSFVKKIIEICTYSSLCSENTYDTVEPKDSTELSDRINMENNPAYADVHVH